ncbi:hypothetical protein [Candidatus Endomicrobiellum trichonymphae]|uniref:hypothetical protein n=1 Tax=Endomicrobium trichonymphae TaxID=1408204 RepID=UPI000BBB2A14|nr:hypothetical protein [Candidatus Endomicrobium trichonymphae]
MNKLIAMLIITATITGCGKNVAGLPYQQTNQTFVQKSAAPEKTKYDIEPSPSPTPPPDPDGYSQIYDQPSTFEKVTMVCPIVSQFALSFLAGKVLIQVVDGLFIVFPSLLVTGTHSLLGLSIITASSFIQPLVLASFAIYAEKKGVSNLSLAGMFGMTAWSTYCAVPAVKEFLLKLCGI